jgi:hypothetical protein
MNEHSATVVSKDGKVETKTFDPKEWTPEAAKKRLLHDGFEIVDFVEASTKQAIPKKTPARRSPARAGRYSPAKAEK